MRATGPPEGVVGLGAQGGSQPKISCTRYGSGRSFSVKRSVTSAFGVRT